MSTKFTTAIEIPSGIAERLVSDKSKLEMTSALTILLTLTLNEDGMIINMTRPGSMIDDPTREYAMQPGDTFEVTHSFTVTAEREELKEELLPIELEFAGYKYVLHEVAGELILMKSQPVRRTLVERGKELIRKIRF